MCYSIWCFGEVVGASVVFLTMMEGILAVQYDLQSYECLVLQGLKMFLVGDTNGRHYWVLGERGAQTGHRSVCWVSHTIDCRFISRRNHQVSSRILKALLTGELAKSYFSCLACTCLHTTFGKDSRSFGDHASHP